LPGADLSGAVPAPGPAPDKVHAVGMGVAWERAAAVPAEGAAGAREVSTGGRVPRRACRSRRPAARDGRNDHAPVAVLLQWDAMAGESRTPLVGIMMGSKSDWETMASAAKALDVLGIPYEVHVMSAHRTPDLVDEYVSGAEGRGLEVIIAGAGGAAHLAGVAAARTLLPVLGVPMQSKALNGIDSLLSTVQMPAGIPVGTLAIG